MRRTNWKTVSTLITMVIIAGCSETAVEPSATAATGRLAASAPTSIRMAPVGAPTLSLAAVQAPSTSADFTVGPAGGVFVVGSNAVVFPTNSICDPATSTYGVGTWDDSCRPLRQRITVHAVTRVANGVTQVDFSPALRFVPSDDPSRWVWLYMSSPSLAGTADLSQFNVLYAPTLDAPLVDESLTDLSLRTYADVRTGTSLRHVKHFSGYAVIANAKCDPNAPPAGTTCSPSDSTTTP